VLAEVKGIGFAGEFADGLRYASTPYFVPTDTLIGLDRAHALGIASEDDLFGGVVPYPFVATKCISHRLVHAGASSPPGWSDAFARAVHHVVLRGFAAFDRRDAQRAGMDLVASGPVRIKRALGIGGRGQEVVHDAAALARSLAAVDAVELARYGIALEEDLADVTTYSVGHVSVDGVTITYCGTQCTTRNNRGDTVYGGSELLVIRGGFDALATVDLPAPARLAVEQARVYDEAALRSFPGFLASRRNYDVAAGIDSTGAVRSGVLEQSWRIGGASGAELAALRAFRDDASLRLVRAASVEVYGEAHVPANGTVYYRGDDNHGGLLTKYAHVEPVRMVHDDSADFAFATETPFGTMTQPTLHSPR
jgi:hypothetical protein